MKRPVRTDQTEEEVETTSTDGEIPILRWSTRRKMAWRCLTILVVATGLYWFVLPLWFNYWALPTTWLTIIGDSYFWFATTLAAVVTVYMGVSPGSMPFSRKSSTTSKKSRRNDPDDDEEYYEV